MFQTVVSKGSFYGLPTFPHFQGQKLRIIVCGANGISGSAMVKVLSEAPERWEKIYALSRRPPQSENPSNVVPIAVDFLHHGPNEIAKALAENHVEADYVYFASYVQPPPVEGKGLWSDVDATTTQNVALLSNFLQALPLANIKPKRILLQTGGKHYGLHLGPTALPMEEDDPRHGIEGNFYFPQVDLLKEYCKQHDATWVETRPCFILGAVENAAMNIVWPLSTYAAIQAHLGKPLDFPGDVAAWDAEKAQSMSTLLGYHAEWALLTPEAGNQALNQSDSSAFAWGKFWPTLAEWYHIPSGQPANDPDAYVTITMPYPVPPRGFGGPGIIRASFSFLEWSKRAEVLNAWDEVRNKHGLKYSPFGDKAVDTFGLLDAEVLGGWGRVMSMDKNRKLGWHGYVDTKDAIKQVIQEMADLHMVPPLE
ncbi:hypothetical protein LTR10_017734 [Elasticomyces elasticus]|uniref:PRISE-like Rossmann-fold domain-containing protein n=1 Tax=Exophiala sideris TaxID=1016849 RepID=A0ABR0JBD3_9EURO|nr:hypothetical protein LTR10_017734 [Elasticomyces elasticus]KAK5031015.1 hypothetical protein LTS07_004750 [Exophiala sideris]KAK5038737.1 hypothetical protein LTR13_003768 [Exophiala sideris]KAK5060620.1 hypothetical protein LTR69_005219 [Exophiala sideris]KAK5183533.1 hypothetical protein LTR44_003815 [Eurotiomycetes sp. CCFEE 6388]